MAANIARIPVTPIWTSVNVLTGIAIGVALKIQLIGSVEVDLAISSAQPTTDIGEVITDKRFLYVAAGETDALWCKTSAKAGSSSLSVQDNT